jgi:hypothetical protein
MKVLRTINGLIKELKLDYSTPSTIISKSAKRRCYLGIVKNLLWSIWSSVTCLFIYPIWYIWRKEITDKIHKGTSWQEIEAHMQKAEISEVEKKLKVNGKFLFWLWTYGDCNDPYGWGGMPVDYRTKKNTFGNRYMWSAIRNPRFNMNYLYFRTGEIHEVNVIIDTRDWKYWHGSYGVGSSPDGIIFQWYRDNNNKWYFIYENYNVNNVFWFGYVGLINKGTIGKKGRFETSYRKTQYSYTGDWRPRNSEDC